MISRIKGKLVDKFNGILTVDVSGVGYEIFTSPYVSSTLIEGTEVEIIVYTDVRENAITLFGFSSRVEKQSFLLLKKVKGIGSKLALSILSVLRPEELMSAIGNSDTKMLTTVSGVGKKSAERIILELREAVSDFVKDSSESFDTLTITESIYSKKFISKSSIDACLALEKLGFSQEKSEKSITQALSQYKEKHSDIEPDTSELVRYALSIMKNN